MYKIFIYSKDKDYLPQVKEKFNYGFFDTIAIDDSENNSNPIFSDYDLVIIHIDQKEEFPIYRLECLRINPKLTNVIVILETKHILFSQELFNLGVIHIYVRNLFLDDNVLVETVHSLFEYSKILKSTIGLSPLMDKDLEKFSKGYIFKSPSSIFALREAWHASKGDRNVILLGETGVGKEIFADIIHRNSHRGKKKMISRNCAHLVKDTANSELFGHAKDAFNNAEEKNGWFADANDTTLFLDEIADLPEDTKPELLRVLNSKNTLRDFFKKGSNQLLHSDVRVIAATNKININNTNDADNFRRDLLYRFIWKITIPPLRERKEEIPFLIEYILKNESKPVTISNEVVELLLRYDYPGNIRELESIILTAYDRCISTKIEVTDLDYNIQLL